MTNQEDATMSEQEDAMFIALIAMKLREVTEQVQVLRDAGCTEPEVIAALRCAKIGEAS